MAVQVTCRWYCRHNCQPGSSGPLLSRQARPWGVILTAEPGCERRFCKPLDAKLVRQVAANHPVIITVEEGSIGGFGSHGVPSHLAFAAGCIAVCTSLQAPTQPCFAACMPESHELQKLRCWGTRSTLQAGFMCWLLVRSYAVHGAGGPP